jgi:hypothetical protein
VTPMHPVDPTRETCEPVAVPGAGLIRASGSPCKAVKDVIDGYGQPDPAPATNALAVACILCHAKPGEPCKTLGAGTIRAEAHVERQLRAERVVRTSPDPDQTSLGGL